MITNILLYEFGFCKFDCLTDSKLSSILEQSYQSIEAIANTITNSEIAVK
jgi:hypothetical protein